MIQYFINTPDLTFPMIKISVFFYPSNTFPIQKNNDMAILRFFKT